MRPDLERSALVNITAATAAAALSLTAVLTVTACSGTAAENAGADRADAPIAYDSADGEAVLAAHGLDGLTGREIVDRLDAVPPAQRDQDLIVSVTGDRVIVDAGGPGETAVPLGKDEFYLSIAPFVEVTHPCTFHSLTTCLGEQQSAPVQLTVRDAATGEVYAEKDTETFANGFVGVWLPRDRTVEVTATMAGRTGTVVTGTGADDPTCMTELRLT